MTDVFLLAGANRDLNWVFWEGVGGLHNIYLSYSTSVRSEWA